ncbi:MAG: hypothetical protein OEY52_10620 [Gammaproteobacteria bacterium]|nr:hypothetical protein [Gammaproteobacteria bacterium]
MRAPGQILVRNILILIVALTLIVFIVVKWDTQQQLKHGMSNIKYPVAPPAIPEHQPLTSVEKVQHEQKKLKLEESMKDLMHDYHNNLSDHDKRASIETKMKAKNEEYKKVMLKLAKDALVEENKKRKNNK